MKTHQMLSVHILPEKFKNATIAGLFWICVLVKLGQGNHMIIETQSLRKTSFSKCFQSTRKQNEKLCFRDGFVWTAGQPVEFKLRFQILPL